jgi:hypothetical protein
MAAPAPLDGDLMLSIATDSAFSFNTSVELRPAAVAYRRDASGRAARRRPPGGLSERLS